MLYLASVWCKIYHLPVWISWQECVGRSLCSSILSSLYLSPSTAPGPANLFPVWMLTMKFRWSGWGTFANIPVLARDTPLTTLSLADVRAALAVRLQPAADWDTCLSSRRRLGPVQHFSFIRGDIGQPFWDKRGSVTAEWDRSDWCERSLGHRRKCCEES